MEALILTQDLFFGSQVSAAARAAACDFRDCATAAELIENATSEPQLVILDLTCGEVRRDLTGLVQRLRSVAANAHVLAFGPHVQELQLQAAAESGCDEVLTRGQFHRQMSERFERLRK